MRMCEWKKDKKSFKDEGTNQKCNKCSGCNSRCAEYLPVEKEGQSDIEEFGIHMRNIPLRIRLAEAH